MTKEFEVVDIAKVKVIRFKDLRVGDNILFSQFRSRVVGIGRDKIHIEQFAFDKDSLLSLDRF